MAKRVYESDNITALAEKIRELTGTSTEYTTYDFADGVEEVYATGTEQGIAQGIEQGIAQGIEQGKEIGYANGYSAGVDAGKSEGEEIGYSKGYDDGYEAGSESANSDPYGVEEMLTTLPFLRKVEFVEAPEEVNPYWAQGMSGAIVSTLYDGSMPYFSYVVIPPWITEVTDGAICCGGADDGGTDAVIFLSQTPPVIGDQGYWSEWGGQKPPKAIFVPDESIEEYKVATNLAAYADLIKPLSEYNGEGYYGGKL